jgi:sugar phosphate permease
MVVTTTKSRRFHPTMQGIGASLSGLGAGVIVDHFGYGAAFLTLGAAAGVALTVFALWMPETAERRRYRCGLGSVTGTTRKRVRARANSGS